ncbi:hypothetical protein GLOIN_2v1789121 [Rhizophagus clarus]|nr:hypothetical protein GLOIN_2v1789121 [Rhizophagus clarus]
MLMLEEIFDNNMNLFIDELKHYHKNVKAFRSFKFYNETSFQTAIENILPNCFISEMRLIADRKDQLYKYMFVDMFLCDVKFGAYSAAFELKYFNLIGLLSGESGRWEENPSYQSLFNLDQKLKNESADRLLDRDYIYWCKDEHKHKSIKVKNYIDNGEIQLNTYINILKRGISSREKVGIFDNRIKCSVGNSFVMGYLIVCFGTERIMVKHAKVKKCDYMFSLNR